LKRTITIILLLTSNLLFGQTSNTSFNFGASEFQSLTYQDFLKNNIRKVEAYSYKIRNSRKVLKDSLLIYRQEFDKDSNKIFGINCNRVYQSHGPTFLTCYSFQAFYNSKGLVIKQIDSPMSIEKKKEYGSLNYNIYQNISTYKYDSVGNQTYECNQHFDEYISISKYTKDTFQLHSVQAKIYETYYNDKGQRVNRYYTSDSTRYLPTKSYKVDSTSVRCSYCHSRGLNDDYVYDESGNVKIWTWYTTENKIHSKKYYYYDSSERLIKQIDSTGWYFTTLLPYWESTTFYEYSNTGKVVTKIKNTEAQFGSSTKKIVTQYDIKGMIKSECYIDDSTQSCTKYLYTYDKDKLTSQISISSNNDKLETYFIYNLRGLLIEEKIIYKDKITQLTRYYYE
jgi:hypothetical protein